MSGSLKYLALVAGAQIVFLLGWALKHEFVRQQAPTVLLETAPVDPRDLLRGDYVILGYKISTLPAPWKDRGLADPQPGRTIYVKLTKRGEFHEYDGCSLDRPDPRWMDRGEVFIRGTVDQSWETGTRVRYGIEQYFVPEGTGQRVEGKLTVEVSLDRNGTAQIKQVFLDGRPWPR